MNYAIVPMDTFGVILDVLYTQMLCFGEVSTKNITTFVWPSDYVEAKSPSLVNREPPEW